MNILESNHPQARTAKKIEGWILLKSKAYVKLDKR